MDSAGRRAAPSVEQLVFEQPDRVDVFQLVRLLRIRDSSDAGTALKLKRRLAMRMMSGDAATRSLTGVARRLHFRADLSAAFPGREVTRCRPVDAARREIEIRTPNYCIAGELGPLPDPFVEWVRDEMRDDDATLAAFLDLFNHRLHVLRHQLKAGQQVALDYALPQDTLQADFLANLAGMASPPAEAQIVLPRRAWLGLTATLTDTRRSAAAALLALRQYLAAPRAQLDPLVGDWRPLSEADQPALGRRAMTLGRDAALGTKVWMQQAGVKLTVPEVDYGRLCALLPPPPVPVTGELLLPAPEPDPLAAIRPQPDVNGDEEEAPLDGYQGLVQMVRLLFDRRVDCTVELTTDADRLPRSILTATPAGQQGTAFGTRADAPRYAGLRLGQTAWLDNGVADGGMRQVSFKIVGDPVREAA